MPKKKTDLVPPQRWYRLTAEGAGVVSATFQNRGSHPAYFDGTVGDATPPTTIPDFNPDDGALKYLPDFGEVNVALADLFPDTSGVAHIWVWCSVQTRVLIRHA